METGTPASARAAARGAGLVVLPSLALYILHAALLRSWIIDDAGITFAYARNLAAGHGLVSQPGSPPVEGFSNPLWTLLIAVLYRLHLFDATWAPKIVSFGLVGAALWLVARDLGRNSPAASWPAVLAPTLLASSTSFVVWTQSGLENALLALVTALSCVVTARAAAGERRLDAAAGALAALCALTRPDGALYGAALPLVLATSQEHWRAGWRALSGRAAAHLAGFVPLYGGYLLFRRAYFGEWVPNTYYAKDKPSLAFLGDSEKWSDLLEAPGPLGLLTAALLVGASVAAALRGRLDARRRALAVHLVLAVTAYMLMPLDWMGEYRFATPFFLFSSWALGEVLAGLWAWESRAPRLVAAGLGLSLVGTSLVVHGPRTTDFSTHQLVPLAAVAEVFGAGFNRLAAVVPVAKPSLLASDVGGAYLDSRLRIYDMVGLCDRTAARTLTTDTPAFHRYVFDEVRPTFIHVHGPWAQWAAFHQSRQLATEYVAIRETWPRTEGPEGGDRPAEPVWADYVRRDALGPDPAASLLALQHAYRGAGMDRLDDI